MIPAKTWALFHHGKDDRRQYRTDEYTDDDELPRVQMRMLLHKVFVQAIPALCVLLLILLEKILVVLFRVCRGRHVS